ncbi:MAG: hypothetical protein PHT33_12810, partial [bacterium]|nr:hypothetical protein [bacterium]
TDGLSTYMRRLLTGYAVAYNLRHKRHGHLFQNRYKSIVCEEDVYFQELVRYIHLNPLRAGQVKSLSELNGYPWCGHAVLAGQMDYQWQDKAYVLAVFGSIQSKAVEAYQRYMQEGISISEGGPLEPERAEFDMENIDSKAVNGNERIMGSPEFIERIISEADEHTKQCINSEEHFLQVELEVKSTCKQNGISIKELKSGSRRGPVSRTRGELAYRLVEDYGVSITEAGRQLGVSTSGISRILSRKSS